MKLFYKNNILYTILYYIMKIIIAGAGWYGLHTASILHKMHDIIILEKNNDFFTESSYYNQNRLHLGFHYPRSYKTRLLCKNGYNKFIEKYNELTDTIDKNYYCIANESILDYETYKHIFEYENIHFDIIKSSSVDFIQNIQGDIFKVNEKLINHQKAKDYFSKQLIEIPKKFGYNIINITKKDEKIIINDELECDFFIDCTYGHLNLNNFFLPQEHIYENTISLIYKKINNLNIDCITLMDGKLPSLFLRDKEKLIYSLTHVEFTPLMKTNDINKLKNMKLSKDMIENTKNNMESSIKKYIPTFEKNFEYIDYFISYKIKNIDNNDARECNIYHNNNIISVNCGKITGIFILEEYLKNIGLLDYIF